MLRQKNISASAPDSTSCVHHQHYPLSYPLSYPVNYPVNTAAEGR